MLSVAVPPLCHWLMSAKEVFFFFLELHGTGFANILDDINMIKFTQEELSFLEDYRGLSLHTFILNFTVKYLSHL